MNINIALNNLLTAARSPNFIRQMSPASTLHSNYGIDCGDNIFFSVNAVKDFITSLSQEELNTLPMSDFPKLPAFRSVSALSMDIKRSAGLSTRYTQEVISFVNNYQQSQTAAPGLLSGLTADAMISSVLLGLAILVAILAIAVAVKMVYSYIFKSKDSNLDLENPGQQSSAKQNPQDSKLDLVKSSATQIYIKREGLIQASYFKRLIGSLIGSVISSNPHPEVAILFNESNSHMRGLPVVSARGPVVSARGEHRLAITAPEPRLAITAPEPRLAITAPLLSEEATVPAIEDNLDNQNLEIRSLPKHNSARTASTIKKRKPVKNDQSEELRLQLLSGLSVNKI